MRYREPRAPQRPEQLCVQVALPNVIARFEQRATRRLTGVVHQDVDPPEPAHRLVYKPLDLTRVAHVRRYRQNFNAGYIAYIARRALESLRISRANGDPHALAPHRYGGRLAEPIAPARNQRDLAR